MSFLDSILHKIVQIAGVSLTEAKFINFVSGATAVYNATTKAVDVTIAGSTGGSVANTIVWKPGVASGLGHVATWAEIVVAIASSALPITVFVDDSVSSPAVIPAGSGLTDCRSLVTFSALPTVFIFPEITVEDGASLRDVASMVGTSFTFHCTGSNRGLVFSYTTPGGTNQSNLNLVDAWITNAGSAPVCTIPNSHLINVNGVAHGSGGSFYGYLDGGSSSVFELTGASAQLLISLFGQWQVLDSAISSTGTAPTGTGGVYIHYETDQGTTYDINGIPVIAGNPVFSGYSGDITWVTPDQRTLGLPGYQVIDATNIRPVTTTDATETTIRTIEVPPNTALNLIITIMGRWVSGSAGGAAAGDFYCADFPFRCQRIGSADVTLCGAAAVETFKGFNGTGTNWSGSIDLSGVNVLVRGNGAADVHVNWKSDVQRSELV